MLTEDQCIEHLPMIKDWDPGLRARFVEAMGKLNGCSAPEPDLAALIGMIVICCEDHEPKVRIRRKKDAAVEARANGIDEETIAAILSPAMPGHLDIFVFANGKELVFGMPIADPTFEFIGTKH